MLNSVRQKRVAVILRVALAGIGALAVMGPVAGHLHGQEFNKIEHLYFSKPYGGADPLPQIVTVTSADSAIEFMASARTSSGEDWLSVSTTEDSRITPAPLVVVVNASSTLAVGSYSGQVVLTGKGRSHVVDVHLVITPPDAPVFDRTPSQFSFSVKAGETPAPQYMQISGLGQAPLQWRLIGSTFNGADFLTVSAQTGTGPTRIAVGVLPDKLPEAGTKAGVYTGQLLFLSAGSTVTVPIKVVVDEPEGRAVNPLNGRRHVGVAAAVSNPTTGSPNLWPANTSNCACGDFNNLDSAYGGLTTAPDGASSSAQLVTEANPGSGQVPHFQYRFDEFGVGPQTLSFHFKADLDSWVYITSRVDGVVGRVYFNLGNGTVGSNIPAGWSAQIISLGSGWYRCAVTFTALSSTNVDGFGLATGDQQPNFIATNGRGVYEWGQQAEHSGTLSPYQANVAPCFSTNVQRDSPVVAPGSPIGFGISVVNQATPSYATTLNAPLPAGTGINWNLSPAYSWPGGTCSITGVVGSQVLACTSANLAAGSGGSMHITSSTSSSSCGVYTTTATVSAGGSQFQASDAVTLQCTMAAMNTPAPGSILSGSTVTFNWAAGAGASAYWLDVGTIQGQGNIFGSNVGLVTTQSVSGIPTNGSPVYVRLWTQISGNWSPNDYTYTAASLGKATMSTPAPGSVLSGSTVTFSWTAGTGASAYWLDVGTIQGQGNIFGSNVGLVTTQSVSGIPTNGSLIYVRLWTQISGNWSPNDYTYTAASLGKATMSTPAPGTVLSGSTVTFSWTAGTGASAYWLDVGTIQGQGNIFGSNVGLVTTQSVSGIPTNGSLIYVRLWTQISGNWSPNDYTYTAASGPGKATMSTPAPGTVLSGSTVTFNWTAANGASAYWLDVGTIQGQGNIFGSNVGLVTSRSVSGIPASGSLIYVRLWTQISGNWSFIDYTYTAAGSSNKAAMTTPSPGSTLSGSTVTFNWTAGIGASAYWLDVGTIQGQGNIFGSNVGLVTSQSVSGIPTNGSTVYVRLWTQISGNWSYNDYVYTAL